jgi:hypothetical protein
MLVAFEGEIVYLSHSNLCKPLEICSCFALPVDLSRLDEEGSEWETSM